jgi:hypothetical protein
MTVGLGIIILQGVSRRKSLAGVNIMAKLKGITAVADFYLVVRLVDERSSHGAA